MAVRQNWRIFCCHGELNRLLDRRWLGWLRLVGFPFLDGLSSWKYKCQVGIGNVRLPCLTINNAYSKSH